MAQVDASLAEQLGLGDEVVGLAVVGAETEEAEGDLVVRGVGEVEVQLLARSRDAALGGAGNLEDVLGNHAHAPDGEREEDLEDHVDHHGDQGRSCWVGLEWE